ncbi:hypothetical protein AMAG_05188 [Allomyces macrogynus ATCC 38327]|uniref:Uncharacterized protein n=1 Tax=Allomyces macrogynus (strain ATCC 38327) TaxID=578462 RepID=A0A0L0SBE2_ALLM3|nr:hypothetical protein AMAG_05188 [Allomyces macrogynus ATCC 38327]|eukprot:KNE59724.1 hypothetical protein AMAG_05188 [Allomyces macrogynus ATCC 38327]
MTLASVIWYGTRSGACARRWLSATTWPSRRTSPRKCRTWTTRDWTSPAIGKDDEQTTSTSAPRKTGASTTTRKQPESSSSSCSRSSTAVPSGKKRPDVVKYPAIGKEPAYRLPEDMQWFPHAVEAERKRTFNPQIKGAAMPKVDVVVVKENKFYYAAGWLAYLKTDWFPDYKSARVAMCEAIGVSDVLFGTDKVEGLAIKAGNKSMWMVTVDDFVDHLCRNW